MEERRINITIAGRMYPLNVKISEEETIRKVGKEIEKMIKNFEKNFDIKDKQDAIAMCALQMGTLAENNALIIEKNNSSIQNKVENLHSILDEWEG